MLQNANHSILRNSWLDKGETVYVVNKIELAFNKITSPLRSFHLKVEQQRVGAKLCAVNEKLLLKWRHISWGGNSAKRTQLGKFGDNLDKWGESEANLMPPKRRP